MSAGPVAVGLGQRRDHADGQGQAIWRGCGGAWQSFGSIGHRMDGGCVLPGRPRLATSCPTCCPPCAGFEGRSLLDGETVGVSIIGFDPSVRGIGVGRGMLQLTEVEAMAWGACRVRLGAQKATKGFYERLGFQGQDAYMHKGLPLPGRSVEFRVRRWLAAIGDLDRGEFVRVDPATSTLPAVF